MAWKNCCACWDIGNAYLLKYLKDHNWTVTGYLCYHCRAKARKLLEQTGAKNIQATE